MEDKTLTAEKFTALAPGWSEKEYAEPAVFMERRASLVCQWGAKLHPGDRLLELGCGDGALSCLLARQGFEVTGVDISRGMIEEAKRRAEREGVAIRFEVADSDHFKAVEPYDCVFSFMGAFFTYMEKPASFIEAMLPAVRKKVMLDWNFRSPCTFVEAAQMMQRAGLGQIEWRPWLIPNTMLDTRAYGLRQRFESRPDLSLLLLIMKRWRYTIHLKGEMAGAEGARSGKTAHGELNGNPLPGSFLQRSLIKLGQVTR